MRDLKTLAKEALDVQTACNLTGVALGMHRAMCDLMAHVRCTDAVNNHPITRLWADKVAHLSGNEQGALVEEYTRVKEMADGPS